MSGSKLMMKLYNYLGKFSYFEDGTKAQQGIV
jgi:hypothetical protein